MTCSARAGRGLLRGLALLAPLMALSGCVLRADLGALEDMRADLPGAAGRYVADADPAHSLEARRLDRGVYEIVKTEQPKPRAVRHAKMLLGRCEEIDRERLWPEEIGDYQHFCAPSLEAACAAQPDPAHCRRTTLYLHGKSDGVSGPEPLSERALTAFAAIRATALWLAAERPIVTRLRVHTSPLEGGWAIAQVIDATRDGPEKLASLGYRARPGDVMLVERGPTSVTLWATRHRHDARRAAAERLRAILEACTARMSAEIDRATFRRAS